MSKKRWRDYLGLQLLAGVLIALGISFGVFQLLDWAGTRALDSVVMTQSFQERQRHAAEDRLAQYVSDHALTLSDHVALTQWVQQERYVFLTLIQDGRVIYDSTFVPDDDGMQAPDLDEAEMFDPTFYGDDSTLRQIDFADGSAQAELICYYEYRYYGLVTAAAGLLAFCVFVVLMLAMLHHKLRYIALLEKELAVLERGDLQAPVTVRGSDELGQLARGIDDMRRAIIERQQGEREALEANRQLITDMSHDLRTPLTSLIGYLDLIALGRYRDPQQLEHFIRASHEKAYQLKEMSDKLFEYALVYAGRERSAPLQQADGLELMQQTVGEYVFELESSGFLVEAHLPEIHCTVAIEPQLLRRVFDNLYSNLLKYADRTAPVQVGYEVEEHRLLVRIANRTSAQATAAESTGVGLRSCEKAMQLQNGGFEVRQEGEQFSAVFWLPCAPQPEGEVPQVPGVPTA